MFIGSYFDDLIWHSNPTGQPWRQDFGGFQELKKQTREELKTLETVTSGNWIYFV